MTTITTKSGAKYLIDEDERTVQRLADHEIRWVGPGEAAPLTTVPREYARFTGLNIGGRLSVDYTDGTWSLSTEIVSIES